MTSPMRNGGSGHVPGGRHLSSPPPPSPLNRHQQHPFHSTVSEQKIRRLNLLTLLLRVVAFCFSLAAAVFTGTNSARSSAAPSWLHFDSFRFVLAANAIVAVYSVFETGVAIWEYQSGATLFPEPIQLWFDLGHDQVFAYIAAAAGAAGVVEAQKLRAAGTCDQENAFCIQADISVALGFVAFLFIALSSLLSGFRVACYIVTGSRFHL